jgi:hypothetical protein
MTIISTANPATQITSLVDEFTGGSSSEIKMMIGVGSVKDSDAVFFEYMGDNQHRALRYASDKPLTSLQNVTLAGINVAENIGEYSATKLNVILESSAGTQVMVTSGITTFWSMAILGGLMALLNGGDLTCPFNLDTWRGNQGVMKPCFASVKVNGEPMKDKDLYTLFTDARQGDKSQIEVIARNAVTRLHDALTGGPVEEAEITVDQPVDAVLADF